MWTSVEGLRGQIQTSLYKTEAEKLLSKRQEKKQSRVLPETPTHCQSFSVRILWSPVSKWSSQSNEKKESDCVFVWCVAFIGVFHISTEAERIHLLHIPSFILKSCICGQRKEMKVVDWGFDQCDDVMWLLDVWCLCWWTDSCRKADQGSLTTVLEWM